MRLSGNTSGFGRISRVNRRLENLDRFLDRLNHVASILFIVGMTILGVMAVSAIAYKIWDVSIGRWAFKFDRQVFPIVGAIILSSQLSRNTAHLHITNSHKSVN